MLIETEKKYSLDSVLVEQRIGDVVADLLADVEGQKLIIEIKVTHEVDEEKLERIRRLGISAVEVDLSDLPRDTTLADLEPPVISSNGRKTWLYNSVADERLRSMISMARTVPTVARGMALHVDYCPIPMRTWNGKPYANVMDDCLSCEYALNVGDGIGSVTCAAFNSDLRSLVDGARGYALQTQPQALQAAEAGAPGRKG